MNRKAFFFILSGLLAAAVVLSLSAGGTWYTPAEICSILTKGSGTDYTILTATRIPRVLLCVLAGATLAMSGCMFQSLLNNPLAEPFTTGVSSGAALGASAGIILAASFPLVALMAFAGSLAAITGVYFISRRVRFGSSGLILAGIAISFILSSAVLILYTFGRSRQVHRALMWLMGDLSMAEFSHIAYMAPAVLLLTAAAFLMHRQLDIISLGSDMPHKLGVSSMEQGILFWIAALLAALCVALCGVIGFVGLITPHIMRYFTGPSHRTLLPASALGGAVLLTASDTLGRSLIPPYEIPVGIITSFFGGIFFLILVVKK